MPRVELTLENLKDLDSGKVQVAFGKELQRCLMDCLNRPNEKKPRKTTLELTVAPIAADGECEKVSIAFDVTSKIPARKTEAYSLGINTVGQAWFHAEEEEDAEQSR